MGAAALCRFPSNCPYFSSLNANFEVCRGIISLSVNNTDNSAYTSSLCSAAQSDRLPPPGPIRGDPCIAPAAGSCLAPLTTLTALLLRVGRDIRPSAFVPCLSRSTSHTFPVLLIWPSLGLHVWREAGAAFNICPMAREMPCPGSAQVFRHDFGGINGTQRLGGIKPASQSPLRGRNGSRGMGCSGP